MLMLNPVDRLPEKLLGYDSFFFSHVIATSTSHESVAQSVFLWILIISQIPRSPLRRNSRFGHGGFGQKNSPHRHRETNHRSSASESNSLPTETSSCYPVLGGIPKKNRWNSWECQIFLDTIWVNYNNSLTWNKAILGWFPLLTMIPVRSQWGRYNLPRYNGIVKNHSPRWRSTMTSWLVQ